MGSRGVGEQILSVEDKQLVDAVGQNLLPHLALDVGTGNNGVELYFQFIGEFATLGQQLLRYFLYLSTFNFAIYKYVVHISYPIIFSSNNSLIIPSTSASEAVKVFDSLAWNTMFLMAFTLVGEPARPHC